jgi:hypothetical protein
MVGPTPSSECRWPARDQGDGPVDGRQADRLRPGQSRPGDLLSRGQGGRPSRRDHGHRPFSDFPNQVNNVLGFPFIFRGRSTCVHGAFRRGMKVAAARALAELAREPVPDSVLRAYDLELSPSARVPDPQAVRPPGAVDGGPAVAEAAMDEGLARAPSRTWRSTRTSSGAIPRLLRADPFDHHPGHGSSPMRVAYPHADDVRIIRAARRVKDEGIGNARSSSDDCGEPSPR